MRGNNGGARPSAGQPQRSAAEGRPPLPGTANAPAHSARAPQPGDPGDATLGKSGSATPAPWSGHPERAQVLRMPPAQSPAGTGTAGAAPQGPAAAGTPATGPAHGPGGAGPANPGVDAGSPANLAHGLSGRIAGMHQAGDSHATLNLNPPGLGQVHVHLRMDGNRSIHVSFTPDSHQAAQAISQSLSRLGDAMSRSGLHLGGAEVNAGGGGMLQGDGSGGQQPGHNAPPVITMPPPTRDDPERQQDRSGAGVSAYA